MDNQEDEDWDDLASQDNYPNDSCCIEIAFYNNCNWLARVELPLSLAPILHYCSYNS